MVEVFDILTQLQLRNSRLFKESVLEKNKDNFLLKRVLIAALDPYTQYYQRKIPKYKQREDQPIKSLEWALEGLKTLTNREYTGNAAIEQLQKILSVLTKDNAEVIKRVVTKDLKCGVSIATVNKIFGKKFIETYPCMLASAFNQKAFEAIKYPALVQTKMDGMRANIIIDGEGRVDVRSPALDRASLWQTATKGPSPLWCSSSRPRRRRCRRRRRRPCCHPRRHRGLRRRRHPRCRPRSRPRPSPRRSPAPAGRGKPKLAGALPAPMTPRSAAARHTPRACHWRWRSAQRAP